MTDKKRVVSLCLSLILVFSFAGCKNKEDINTEKPNNEIFSGEKAKTENNSIVGTWVVVKTEVYGFWCNVRYHKKIKEYIDNGFQIVAQGWANKFGTIVVDI